MKHYLMMIGDNYLMLLWEIIYSMLSWNVPVKIRELTICIMRSLDKYDLKKIIQPTRLFKFRSKRCWESCARIISSKNMSKMSDDVIDSLFRWLQDMNWPGAEIIYDYFLSSPYDFWIKNFEKSIQDAINEDDDQWLTSLNNLVSDLELKKEVFTDADLFDFISNWNYDE